MTLENLKNIIGASNVQAIRDEAKKWLIEGKDLRDFLGINVEEKKPEVQQMNKTSSKKEKLTGGI